MISDINKMTLYEELRLIEVSESEVNGAWKGAHLLLFFLAFVFGSFCTFCFHMLMYLFDEKCVLFPKLLSLTTMRHSVIYEFIPDGKDDNTLPVDFLTTQFVDKSACYLPTYVPLVSAIFGLVWITMFLMCSAGIRSLSGLQRSWRVVPPVLVFSLAMSSVCIYSSAVTHYGLKQLCEKLGVVTGSSTCSYTVNVAMLAYERQIRGVYQATRLTIASAWIHTGCWVASFLLAAARILLGVDFRLVKVRAELVGDVDKMLERDEKLLRTIFPQPGGGSQTTSTRTKTDKSLKLHDFGRLIEYGGDVLFISERPFTPSQHGLLEDEHYKLLRINAYKNVLKEHRFIVDILYDALDCVDYMFSDESTSTSSSPIESSSEIIVRQYGQQSLAPKLREALYLTSDEMSSTETTKSIETKKDQNKHKMASPKKKIVDLSPGPSNKQDKLSTESDLNAITSEEENNYKEYDIHSDTSIDATEKQHQILKSSLKTDSKEVSIETERKHKRQKVTIASSKDVDDKNNEDDQKDEKTVTKTKEKQD